MSKMIYSTANRHCDIFLGTTKTMSTDQWISATDNPCTMLAGKTFKWHWDCSRQEGLWVEKGFLWHWGARLMERNRMTNYKWTFAMIGSFGQWIHWWRKRDGILKLWNCKVNTAKAEAEMAYGLQASKVQARIKEEEMQVLTNVWCHSCFSFWFWLWRIEECWLEETIISPANAIFLCSLDDQEP